MCLAENVRAPCRWQGACYGVAPSEAVRVVGRLLARRPVSHGLALGRAAPLGVPLRPEFRLTLARDRLEVLAHALAPLAGVREGAVRDVARLDAERGCGRGDPVGGHQDLALRIAQADVAPLQQAQSLRVLIKGPGVLRASELVVLSQPVLVAPIGLLVLRRRDARDELAQGVPVGIRPERVEVARFPARCDQRGQRRDQIAVLRLSARVRAAAQQQRSDSHDQCQGRHGPLVIFHRHNLHVKVR